MGSQPFATVSGGSVPKRHQGPGNSSRPRASCRMLRSSAASSIFPRPSTPWALKSARSSTAPAGRASRTTTGAAPVHSLLRGRSRSSLSGDYSRVESRRSERFTGSVRASRGRTLQRSRSVACVEGRAGQVGGWCQIRRRGQLAAGNGPGPDLEGDAGPAVPSRLPAGRESGRRRVRAVPQLHGTPAGQMNSSGCSSVRFL